MLEARMVWSVGNSTFFNLRPGILLFKRCGLGNNAMCLHLLLHLLRTRQVKQVLGHKAPPPQPGNSSGDNTATRAAQPQRDSLPGLHTALQEKEAALQLLDPTRQSPEMAVFQVITTRRLET